MPRKTFISEGGQTWFIRFSSKTHNEAGKPKQWTHYASGPVTNVFSYLAAIIPYQFLGCNVTVMTPIHHYLLVVDPDTRKVSETTLFS